VRLFGQETLTKTLLFAEFPLHILRSRGTLKKGIVFLLISLLLLSIATGLIFSFFAIANSKTSPNNLATLASPDLPSNDWPMFLYNAGHTSSPDDVAPITHDLLWRFNTMPNGADAWIIDSSPAVVGGVLYIGSDDGCFYALDSASGTLLWNRTIGTFAVSSPAVVKGIVYVSVWEGRDYALNASTGEVLWNSSRMYSSSSPAVVNGLHYICSGNSSVIVRNATTGSTVWQSVIPGGGECAPVVADNTVYISDYGYACALDALNGTLKWTCELYVSATYNSPAVANGIVYVGCGGNTFYALDAQTGETIWTYETGSSGGSAPTVADGIVYVGSLTKGVFALNATNGALIWNYPSSIWDSSFALAGGILYACNSAGIHALDAKTGTQIWEYTPSNTNINSAPAVANGMLYVRGGDCYLYAFGEATQSSISLSPKVNLAGTTVSISGAGFTSNSIVTASFGDQPVTLSDPEVDYLGHFLGNFQINPSTTPGTYKISVTDNASATACANFTVVGSPATSWPMFMHDLQHSGTADKIPVTSHDLLWKFVVDRGDIMNAVDSSPAVVNGILYEGSQNGYLYALDAYTGTCFWRFNTGCSNLPSPVVVDAVVYIATMNGVYAVNAYTGEQIWKTTEGRDFFVSTPAVSDGMLYVGSMIGHSIYAFRTSDGQLVWQYSTGDYVNSSPAIYGNAVYVGGNDGYLYALDSATGGLRWKFNGGGANPYDSVSSPVVYDGVVYTSCYDGNVYALDAESGSVIWNHTTTKLESTYASPSFSNGIVYLSAGSGVYALNAANGAELWHFTTGDQYPIQASPAVAGGVVYVGGNNGNLYALNTLSGSELWHYNTGSPIVSTVAIDHGVLYLGLRAGAIIALGTPDFIAPQPTPTPTPPPSPSQPIADWNQTYGTAHAESATSMIQTNDGGYLLVGSTNASGNNDIWIVKTDTNGSMLWNQTYGGTLDEYANGAVQTVDGGYAICGYVRNGTSFVGPTDAYLVKTDASGNLQWNQTYGGSRSDEVNSVIQTSDGGYIMGGSTSSFGAGGSDFWLVKVDSSGNAQWNQTNGGTSGKDVQCMIQTDDGGYALVGVAGGDGWVVKTDAHGYAQWEQTYGGNGMELFASVVQADDGGYVLSGVTTSFGAGNGDMYVVKTDRYGNVQWNATYGGANLDGGFSVIQNKYGEYVVVGFTSSSGLGGYDAVLVRFDSVGNVILSRTFGGPGMDLGRSVVQTSDGSYVFGGYTASFGAGDYDFWLVKTSEISSITADDYDGLWHNSDFTITLTVTDSSGRSEIYYRITGVSIQTVGLNGQPYFTLESGANTLEYWSVDGVGNEEIPHKLLTEIKLDKTAPTGSIVINGGESSTTSTSVALTLTAADSTSDTYQIRFSNDGIWDTEQWEASASVKTWMLTSGDGIKTVYYQVMDTAGLVSVTYSDTITLTSPPTDSGDSGASSGSGLSSGTTLSPTPTPSPSPAPTPTLPHLPEPTESPSPPSPDERPLFLIATGVGVMFATIGATMFILKRRR
jgi:outer membrane protein assembly factor BamB